MAPPSEGVAPASLKMQFMRNEHGAVIVLCVGCAWCGKDCEHVDKEEEEDKIHVKLSPDDVTSDVSGTWIREFGVFGLAVPAPL
jgi:hypothetical protein